MARTLKIFRFQLFLLILTCGSTVWSQRSEKTASSYAEEHARFATAMARVPTASLEDHDLTLVESSHVAARRPRDRQIFFLPPPVSRQPAAGEIILEIRREHAARLWGIAQSALHDGDWEFAFRLAHEVGSADASHREARRVVRLNQSQAKRRVRRMPRRHPDYGWPGGRHWRGESAHFVIQSNHSAGAVRDLADDLEVLHAVWRQAFVSCWAPRSDVEALFAGKGKKALLTRRHRVVLFRERHEYNQRLVSREPQVSLTLGMYRPVDRTSYFFVWHDDPDMQRANWRHEVVHQLFQESLVVTEPVAEERDAWIVEGIAMYMESLQRFPGYCSLGGVDAPRLQHARFRWLGTHFYRPLRRAAELGRAELQADPEIRALYSQFAGWTHFLMDGRCGAWRDGLMQYVRDVYAGHSPGNNALPEALQDLDEEYKTQFLQVEDEDLVSIPASRSLPKLFLGRTHITEDGLKQLAQAPVESLTWLDVSHCATGDEGLFWIDRCTRLEQLSLEDTAITDATLALLADLNQLEELDLSGTRISDAGLRHLTSLHALRSLWLSRTAVTKEGVDCLLSLPNLEHLAADGTAAADGDGARGQPSPPSAPPR